MRSTAETTALWRGKSGSAKARDDRVDSLGHDCSTLIRDVAIGRNGGLYDILEVIDLAERSELRRDVVAELLGLDRELIDQLRPPVDKDDDVVDVETGENVAGTTTEPRRELGCNDDWRCDRPNPFAGREFELDRRGNADLVPRIREPEDLFEVGITSIARPNPR